MPQSPLEFLHTLKTEGEVVQAVHAYLAAWLPASLARLPLPVRASEVREADDISSIAVGIAQRRLDPRISQDIRDVLDQLHPFFSEASSRLSYLRTYSVRKENTREAMRRLFG